MKSNIYSKVKTINLDSHIFRQDFAPIRSKLPSHLLKTLAQRKRRQPKLKIIAKRTNASYFTQDQDGLQKLQVLTPLRMALSDQKTANDSFLTNNNRSKTIFSNKRHSSQSEHLPNFRRYHASPFLPKNPNETTTKLNEQQVQQNQDLFEIELKEVSPMHNKIRFEQQRKLNLNPYTKDEYIYMKNQQIDQMIRIQRSGKLRRISSITKSYKVGTIELIPSSNHKTISLKMQPPNHMQTNDHHKSQTKTQAKRQMQVEPSPWEWGLFEQQKDELL